MKSNVLMFLIIISSFLSCKLFNTLHSNTIIDPWKDFVLGNNKHEGFKVHLRNDSKHTIQIYLAPISGGTHTEESVAPQSKIFIKVDKNTAMVIQNKNKDTASVTLKVKGDTGLNMGYQ